MTVRTARERMKAGRPEAKKVDDLKAGDILEGYVEEVRPFEGDYGLVYITDVFNPETGDAFGLMWKGILKSKFAEQGVGVGSFVTLRYEGTKPSKVKGHEAYHDWWVIVDNAERQNGSVPTAAAAPAGGLDPDDDDEEPF